MQGQDKMGGGGWIEGKREEATVSCSDTAAATTKQYDISTVCGMRGIHHK